VNKGSSISSLNDEVYIVVTLIFGALYDVIGRKIPAVIFYLFVVLGWVVLP